MIEQLIDSIVVRLVHTAPSVKRALRPPATAELRKHVADKLGLKRGWPFELDAWFARHDGEDLDLLEKEECFDPDRSAYNLLSLEAAMEAWTFLTNENKTEEILQPWSRDWLPLAENGAGDYMVYVLAGTKVGQLLDYYHDDKKRPKVASTFEAYLKSVDQQHAQIEKSRTKKTKVQP